MSKNRIDLLRTFYRTLKSYLARNGSKILSLAQTAGQKHVRISALGLYRYYKPLLNEPKVFAKILEEIYNDNELSRYLKNTGIEIKEALDKYRYEIVLSLETLRKLMNELRDDERGNNDQ